jgi:hypothetical protein
MRDGPMRSTNYAGLFLVTMATLMHELLLTRIFSVTMWYHFAFMAISIAMFGTTVGALVVYLLPRRFPPERATAQLASFALAYAATAVASLAIHLRTPISDEESFLRSPALLASYVVIAVPFALSGVVVTLALTRFPRRVARLYAADLCGAAAGCIALVHLLEWTDGPSGILVIAAASAAGALLFAAGDGRRLLAAGAGATALGLLLLAAAPAPWVQGPGGLLRVHFARGRPEPPHLYERWNSFSRVHVDGDPSTRVEPTGWGLSKKAPKSPRLVQLSMGIDVSAKTVISEFHGDPRPLEYLKYDVTNLAHHLRPGADVAVIGVGGGRDVLSALVFGQESVLGIEINENVLDATNRVFGSITGHLDEHPKVSLVVDEARSHLARSTRRFDIIQISLIDTWAATAAGAFTLAENSLYTVEAWQTFLERLAPDGVLSVSRWYFNARPAQALRMTSLAVEALERIGVRRPEGHVLLVKIAKATGAAGAVGNGVATMLVSPSPFTRADLETLSRVCLEMGFEPVLTPERAEDPAFHRILSDEQREAFYDGFPLDVRAPTDDRPFFFQMLRLSHVFDAPRIARFDANRANLKAVRTLGVLVVIVAGLTALCIGGPLLATLRRVDLSGAGPLLLYFAAIGLGFMFIEIAQMQRLMVFLGHPTYALSVVLFTLLLASGAGSLLQERLPDSPGTAVATLAALLAVVAASGWATPWLTETFASSENSGRILAAGALLAPMGLLMGTAFPLGMRAAARRSPDLTPWLWGVNGATSVLCSVLAVAVSLSLGISWSFFAGVACYALALAAGVHITRR